jgi:FtsP/CotA-like multicopper oxidase with cupredoxin domain
MRHLHLILVGVAIPLLLTATVFIAPSRGGIIGNQVNDATKLQEVSPLTSSTSGLIPSAEAAPSYNHVITLGTAQLDNGQVAYKMVSHTKTPHGGGATIDLTSNYSSDPSIPGPTIVLTEGDTVDLTIENNLGTGIVGVHVHGVHYDINSDGTLEHINHLADQGATPGSPFTVHWSAGPGTVGTWPYHDHTFGGLNGAENKGLFGTVIVNPAGGQVKTIIGNSVQNVAVSSIKKDFVLYLGDDAFWGMEINSATGKQTPLWVNPTLKAKTGDYVRFHLIALGTDLHTFQMSKYQWLDPGTSNKINKVDIGPLENHQFTIQTKTGTAQYFDQNTSNNLMGMAGTFVGSTSGGVSIPGPSPL